MMIVNAYPAYALMVAGIIFGLVALMHLVRLIYRWPIIIAGKRIPMWASGLGFIVPLLLSIWMLTATCPGVTRIGY